MTRRTELLDGVWSFLTDRDEKGEQRGWHTATFDSEGWLQAPVPGTWESYLDGLFGYAGHAWYRREFRVDPAWQGSRVLLRFEAANYETTVWLNGELLGVHRGGFDPFDFDITDRLDWGDENVLAVRVDNWPRLNRVPNSMAGWWNYGGIFRSVKLLSMPTVRIDDVFVHAEPGEGADDAPLTVEVMLVNESTEPVDVSVNGRVALGEGAVSLTGDLSCAAQSLAPGERRTIRLAAGIPAARLWSPDRPNLYTLHLGLLQDGVPVDTQAVRFGVRKFEVRGTQFFLNGEPILLTGFNRHEEYYGNGRVDPGGVLQQDLRAIKEMNGNMVRMHYQSHPDMYVLCDEMGLMCFAEIPMWGVANKDLSEWEAPEVWETTEQMLRTLIGSLKNHASVVIWSVGNECATNREEARPLIGHLADLARTLDATRPVAYVGMFGADEKCFDLVDIPCLNVYRGLDHAAMKERADLTQALEPGKPLLMTEFGHEAVHGLHGVGYGTEDEQAEVLEGNWLALHELSDRVAGTIIWCLADYWHMPMGPDFHWMNRIYFSHGVLTLDRKPKMAVETVKRMWSRVD